MLRIGSGVAEDERASYTVARKACEMGSVEACSNVLYCMNNRDRLSDAMKKMEGKVTALRLQGFDLEKVVGLGDEPCRDDATAPMRERVLAGYRAACDAGKGGSCMRGASTLRDDLEGAQPASAAYPDDPRAWTARGDALLQSSCDQGDPEACEDLAWHLLLADYVSDPKTKERIADLKNRACVVGGPIHCVGRADDLIDGTEPSAGIDLLRGACDGGSALGCQRLAEHEREGKHAPLDVAAALSHFARACVGPTDALLGESCLRAAELSREKDGVDAAVPYWKRACKLGQHPGCKRLEEHDVGKGTWVTVRAEDGTVSFVFPAQPKHQTRGDDESIDRWTVEIGALYLRVEVEPIAPGTSPDLEGWARRVSANKKLRGEPAIAPTTFAGHPAVDVRYVVVDADGGDPILLRRLLVVRDDRYVELVSSSEEGKAYDSAIDRFFAGLFFD